MRPQTRFTLAIRCRLSLQPYTPAQSHVHPCVRAQEVRFANQRQLPERWEGGRSQPSAGSEQGAPPSLFSVCGAWKGDGHWCLPPQRLSALKNDLQGCRALKDGAVAHTQVLAHVRHRGALPPRSPASGCLCTSCWASLGSIPHPYPKEGVFGSAAFRCKDTDPYPLERTVLGCSYD